MAEPLTETRTEGLVLPSRPSEGRARRPDRSHDPIREAIACLDQAGKRLNKGGAERTDEALSLLRAAALHLEQAVEPRPRLSGD